MRPPWRRMIGSPTLRVSGSKEHLRDGHKPFLRGLTLIFASIKQWSPSIWSNLAIKFIVRPNHIWCHYLTWVTPGHCDLIHAVEPEHTGAGDSSVLYIPVVPLTLKKYYLPSHPPFVLTRRVYCLVLSISRSNVGTLRPDCLLRESHEFESDSLSDSNLFAEISHKAKEKVNSLAASLLPISLRTIFSVEGCSVWLISRFFLKRREVVRRSSRKQIRYWLFPLEMIPPIARIANPARESWSSICKFVESCLCRVFNRFPPESSIGLQCPSLCEPHW